MIKVIRSIKELDFSQIFAVYEESICQDGKCRYPYEPDGVQILLAQQELYSSWEVFFQDKTAVCALWVVDGHYCAALRLERYCDGYLLNSLETAPDARRKGYATALVKALIKLLKEKRPIKLYSHIDKHNHISITVHRSCGFYKIMDYAVYLDGSVLHSSDTYICDIE